YASRQIRADGLTRREVERRQIDVFAVQLRVERNDDVEAAENGRGFAAGIRLGRGEVTVGVQLELVRDVEGRTAEHVVGVAGARQPAAVIDSVQRRITRLTHEVRICAR